MSNIGGDTTERVIFVMDTVQAIEVMKREHIYDRAEAECIRRKLDEYPYDMCGHNKVYCQFITEAIIKKKRLLEEAWLRDEKENLQIKSSIKDLEDAREALEAASRRDWENR